MAEAGRVGVLAHWNNMFARERAHLEKHVRWSLSLRTPATDQHQSFYKKQSLHFTLTQS
jgi:hypothetical protein